MFRLDAHADSVTKFVQWNDGGAEAVFADGTVIAFKHEMATATVVHSATPQRPPEMMLTPLALSGHHAKLTAALEVYNRFSVRPRLIMGLTAQPVELWQRSSPLDTTVLSLDRSLVEFVATTDVKRQTATSSAVGNNNENEDKGEKEAKDQQSSNDNNIAIGAVTLHCAMRRVKMTLHPHEQLITVQWNALVLEPDGCRTIFASLPTNHGGGSSLATYPTHRYVQLEQIFPALHVPCEWRPMLEVLLEAKRLLEQRVPAEEWGAHSRLQSTVSLLLPSTLEAPNAAQRPRAGGLSSASMSCSSPSLFGGSNLGLRSSSGGGVFAVLDGQDAHAFVAASHIHSLAVQRLKLHSAQAKVRWRYDRDPLGRVPHAFYSCQTHTPSSADGVVSVDVCCAVAFEDQSVIVGQPLSTTRDGPRTVVLQHHRGATRDEEVKEYVQDAALSVPLPKVLWQPANPPQSSRSNADCVMPMPSPTPLGEGRGRYLPYVAETIVSLVLGNSNAVAAATTIQIGTHSTATAYSPPNASVECSPSNGGTAAVVKLTSRLDGVGTFTALTNGVVKVQFDDRMLLTLIPDATDSDEGLLAQTVGRNAEVSAVRVALCVGQHPLVPYLAYAMPFRHFARMPVHDCLPAHRSEPPSCIPSTTTTAAGVSVEYPRQYVPPQRYPSTMDGSENEAMSTNPTAPQRLQSGGSVFRSSGYSAASDIPTASVLISSKAAMERSAEQREISRRLLRSLS